MHCSSHTVRLLQATECLPTTRAQPGRLATHVVCSQASMLQNRSWHSHAAWSSLPLLGQQDSPQRPHGHFAGLIHHEGTLLQAAAPGLAPTQAQQVASVHNKQRSNLQGRHSQDSQRRQAQHTGMHRARCGSSHRAATLRQEEAGSDEAVKALQ